MDGVNVLVLYNEPTMSAADPEHLSESGVLWTLESVCKAVASKGHAVDRLGIGNSIQPLVTRLESSLRPDVVFNLCEGLGGSGSGEAQVASVLELFKIPFTGSDSECLSLVRTKARAKWLLAGAGLPTAEFALVRPDDPVSAERFQSLLKLAPLIVKPASEDASMGVALEGVVTTWADLEKQIYRIRDRYGDALVERFIDGREINVSVLALPTPKILPFSEIEFRLSETIPWGIVAYDAKWTPESEIYEATPVHCPANVDAELGAKLTDIALRAFDVLRCRDYARLDIRVDKTDRPYILEVNANPDISSTAGFTDAVRKSGLAYEDFVSGLVEQAIRRRRHATTLGQASPAKNGKHERVNIQPTFRGLSANDVPSLRQLLVACGNFRPVELDVAEELLREHLKDGPNGHYQVVVAEINGRVAGYACYGLVSMTDGAYDLYWIAVDPACQNAGVGRAMLGEVEARLRRQKGRWILAETSDLPNYEATRTFYGRSGFQVIGRVQDFYRPDDGRITYGKRIDG